MNKTKINTYLDKAIFFSLFYIIITIPLPYKFSNLGIVALALSWLLKKGFSQQKIRSFKSEKGINWITVTFFLLFIWQLISLFYTKNLDTGFKNLESKLSFIVLPLIMADIRLNRKELIRFIKLYIYSIALCSTALISLSIFNYIKNGAFLIYHDFTEVLGFHAVFYSYCLYLAVLLIYYLLRIREHSKVELILYALASILSFASLVISASKNVLVVTIISILILSIFSFIRGKVKMKHLVVAGSIIVICLITFSQSTSIKNRVNELTQLNGIENLEIIKSGGVLSHEDRIKFNGTSLRIVFWHLGLKKLKDYNRYWIGLSSGDRKDVMNKEFYSNGLNPAYEDYNIHNQYLQILVELGIVGLLIYLALNFSLLREGLYEKNYILIAFLAAFTVFQMTESVLERNKGIVFFVFFLLFISKLKFKSNEDRNHRN